MDVRRLGVIDYAEALALQEDLVARRARDEIPDTLLLLEHPAVFTLGRGTDDASLPSNDDTPVVRINRGGDVTWHGPGQTVGYWIRKLEGEQRDLHAHLRTIEDALIAALAKLGIDAGRNEGLTGVWTNGRKIASIGVAVKSWVSYHGFALNVAVDPAVYDVFRPCGLDGAVMTDVATELGRAPSDEEMLDALAAAFEAHPTC